MKVDRKKFDYDVCECHLKKIKTCKNICDALPHLPWSCPCRSNQISIDDDEEDKIVCSQKRGVKRCREEKDEDEDEDPMKKKSYHYEEDETTIDTEFMGFDHIIKYLIPFERFETYENIPRGSRLMVPFTRIYLENFLRLQDLFTLYTRSFDDCTQLLDHIVNSFISYVVSDFDNEVGPPSYEKEFVNPLVMACNNKYLNRAILPTIVNVLFTVMGGRVKDSKASFTTVDRNLMKNSLYPKLINNVMYFTRDKTLRIVATLNVHKEFSLDVRNFARFGYHKFIMNLTSEHGYIREIRLPNNMLSTGNQVIQFICDKKTFMTVRYYHKNITVKIDFERFLNTVHRYDSSLPSPFWVKQIFLPFSFLAEPEILTSPSEHFMEQDAIIPRCATNWIKIEEGHKYLSSHYRNLKTELSIEL